MENTEFRLSVSKTKTFTQCKKQYKFSYVMKLPKKDRDYHIFGKFCHKVLEDFHNDCMNFTNEPYHKLIGKAFKASKLEYQNKMTPEMIKECFDIINQYLKLITKDKQNNEASNVIACEKQFNLNIGDNVILNGMIDRIQIDADNVVHVADYKTTKNKKYLKDDFFQLLTYAYVLLEENPDLKKIRASYVLLRHNFEWMTTEFDVAEIKSIKGQYIEYAHQMLDEKTFEANPTPLCAFCDFLELCDEGKKFNNSKSYGNNTIGEVNW